jgi:torulene dioxygenase
MDFSRDEVSGEPVHRRAADLQHDYEQIVRNNLSKAYVNWPNEAGFLGLEEERGPIETKVHGNIPEWVEGSLYRTGPGVYEIEDTAKGPWRTSHWFDGLAQTHRFDIKLAEDKQMKVFYSSRRQSQRIVDQIRRDGHRAGYSFGQKADPCLGIYGKFMAAWSAMSPDANARGRENVSVTVQLNPPLKPDVKLSDSRDERDSSKATLANGHRTAIPKDVWVLTDTAGMKQIDPTTLEPIGFAKQSALHPDLKGQMSCAHAHRDSETGDFFNYNLEMGRKNIYRVFRVSATTGETEILATIQRQGVKPAYIHSFFLSERFVVLCIPSSHLAWNGLSVAWNRNVMDGLEPFDQSKKTQWFVVDRRLGKGVVAEFQTDAGFFFHTVNAFEERDAQDRRDGTVSLFCDLVGYRKTDILHGLYMDVILRRNGAAEKFWDGEEKIASSNTHLERFRVRVPLPEGEGVPARPTLMSDVPVLVPERLVSIAGPHSGELPTINPCYATRRSRYVYALSARGYSSLLDSLVKTDVETGDVVFWNNPHGHTPGEAVFVPRPGEGNAEDDGVLLVVVLDGHRRNSYLVCLDARTMRELGRADVPVAVGIGFHGAHNKL